MKRILVALCAMFITSALAFAEDPQGQVVGSGEMPEATAPLVQTPTTEPHKQEPVQEDATPVQETLSAPASGDSPKTEPEVLGQSGTMTIVRYRTVNNRTVVRQVDNRELKKLQSDFAAYQRQIDKRFALTKAYADAKADKARADANRYTDQKAGEANKRVDALDKKLEPRLAAVEEQGNGLALILGVLGILGIAGLFMAVLARR